MDRIALSDRIIRAKKSGYYFKNFDKFDNEIFNDILGYPEFQEFNGDLKKKASCIILGYKPKCEICGNDVQIGRATHKTIFGGWRRFCSNTCSNIHKHRNTDFGEKVRKTNIEKYGASSHLSNNIIREKIKSTNLQKYGVENVFAADCVKETIKQTNIKMYGVAHPMHNNEIKEKLRQTNIKMYGVAHNWASPELRLKTKLKTIDKYGDSYDDYLLSIKNKFRNSILKHRYEAILDKKFLELLIKNDENGLKNFLEKIIIENNISERVVLSTTLEYSLQLINRLISRLGLSHYFPAQTISNSENEVFEFVQSLGVNTVQSDRSVLEGKELDIYIPENNLAIEFDGIYWHSINGGTDKNYHLEKTEKCESKGIQLLHIFEPEWEEPAKQQIWKSIIKAKLGIFDEIIFARKCKVVSLPAKEARNFLDKNHLQGFTNGKTHLGLVYNNTLVSVISFGSSRFKKNETEIIRFASLLNTRVQGGFSKLLKQIKCDNLVSFADRRYSSDLNNVYSKTMTPDSISSPSFWVYDDGILKHRLGYQKHLLRNKLKTYDHEKTAMDNLLENNKLVIYDCGNLKYRRNNGI